MNPERIHVLPINDSQEHDESLACPCHPTIEENGVLIIHNAFDGREWKEMSNQLK